MTTARDFPRIISVDGTGWFHKNNNKSGGQLGMLRKFLRETDERCAA